MNSQGVLVPVELGWKPKFGDLAGDYQLGGWYDNSAAPNVATSLNGEPILVSGLPGLPGHGRYGFSTELKQQLTHDSASADPKTGLYAFFNATFADRRTSTQDYQIALGLIQGGSGLRGRRMDLALPSARRRSIRTSRMRRLRPTAWASGPDMCSAMVCDGSLVRMAGDGVDEFEIRCAIRHLSRRL